MKLNSSIFLLALHAFGVYSSPSADAAAECGSLGVMKYDTASLPATVHPSKARKCLNHPSGNAKQTLEKRFCWFGRDKGCTDNSCWKSCGVEGSGQWCWTAKGGGYGDWIGCNNHSDCSYDYACGIGLECDTCGCSC